MVKIKIFSHHDDPATANEYFNKSQSKLTINKEPKPQRIKSHLSSYRTKYTPGTNTPNQTSTKNNFNKPNKSTTNPSVLSASSPQNQRCKIPSQALPNSYKNCPINLPIKHDNKNMIISTPFAEKLDNKLMTKSNTNYPTSRNNRNVWRPGKLHSSKPLTADSQKVTLYSQSSNGVNNLLTNLANINKSNDRNFRDTKNVFRAKNKKLDGYGVGLTSRTDGFYKTSLPHSTGSGFAVKNQYCDVPQSQSSRLVTRESIDQMINNIKDRKVINKTGAGLSSFTGRKNNLKSEHNNSNDETVNAIQIENADVDFVGLFEKEKGQKRFSKLSPRKINIENPDHDDSNQTQPYRIGPNKNKLKQPFMHTCDSFLKFRPHLYINPQVFYLINNFFRKRSRN